MAKFFAISSTLILLFAIYFSVSNAKSVTYPLIGTFTDKDFYDPTWRPIVALPESPEKIRPTFFLYTPKTPNEPEILIWNDADSLKTTQFDPKLNTKVVTHGLMDSIKRGHWMELLKDDFLKLGDFNVILLDWKHGDTLPYSIATANTRVVGAMLGVLIENICKMYNISPASFHVLGHSLGAHIAGYTGKHLNGTLGHITGFDPAGPYYEGLKDTRARLWHTDALFVESIHTDAHHLIPYFGFGMYETCSHVDFFPNGGRFQPGCDQERFTTIFIKGLVEGARRIIGCNHQRSVDFYTEAILNPQSDPMAYACEDYKSFEQGKCTSCGEDGMDCAIIGPKTENYKKFVKNPSVAQGKRFFLTTAPHSKFFKYQYLVRIHMAEKTEKMVSTHGIIDMFFEDGNGNTQKVLFNKSDEIFEYGTTYAQVVVSDVDPTQLADEIKIKFVHGHRNVEKWFIYIDSIEIVPLSVHSGEKIPGPKKFVAETNVISNKHVVVFKRSG